MRSSTLLLFLATAALQVPLLYALADTAAPAPVAAAAPATAPAAMPRYEGQIAPLLTTYCFPCHAGQEPKGEVSLAFADEMEAREAHAGGDGFWERVATELRTKAMPPANAKRKPGESERALLLAWSAGLANPADEKPDPGPFVIHRLNNREYANTLRDLLYLPADWNAAADFPPDERGDGFDTNSATLTISPILVEHYLEAAEKSVSAAFKPPRNARDDQTLPYKSPLNAPSAKFKEDFADRQAKVRLNIEVFAPRAYRRPVTKKEIDDLMKFAALSFAHDGESFDKATGLAIRAAIMSPEFLFRLERDPNPGGSGGQSAGIFQLTEFQLASRMSYFLWASMPDDELFAAAREGKLRETLGAQIGRMLKDPKGVSLTKDFLGQWLEIRSLEKIPNCPPELLHDMKEETEHFFNYIVQEDRPITDFLDCNYAFVNERLARHYGIAGVAGEEFRKVAVDPRQRGGLFTQGSFLTLTAKPLEVKGSAPTRRTSPVNRGKWILENIFNERIPPPPPNVPPLAIDDGHELKGTVRQIFEQHRADPTCAACHARMDPYGFALENYDGYGAWRVKDNNEAVDPSGEIGGKKYATPQEFRALLAARREEFRRAFVTKMLSYALGRGIQSFDKKAIDAICAAVQADGDRFSSVIVNIATCYPFNYARAGPALVSAQGPASAGEAPVRK